LAALHRHIRKCREASSIMREGKSSQKFEKTINLQGGIGGGAECREASGIVRRGKVANN